MVTTRNCSQWRSLTPSDALNAHSNNGLSAKLIHITGFIDFLNPAIQDLVMQGSVIVLQRNLVDQAVYDAMEYFQGMGKPVVVDLDDAYHILPWSNPAHKFWLEMNDNKHVGILEEGLRRSNGLLAPNRLLLSDWAHVAQGYYLPNFAEKKWWENLPNREEIKKEAGLEDKIIIGWGGSVSHYDSWWGSGIREAAKRVCERHPNVVWMICGNDPRIYDQLPVSRAQKIQQPGVEPTKWPSIVKVFDIGVAPLFGPYDQRRSWIKGLEYMLAGVPWIATAGEPYRDLSQFGALIKNDVDEWEGTLEEYVTKISSYQEMANQYTELATAWFASNQTDTYKNVFESIINNSRERSGVGRLPGIYYVSPEGIKTPA